MNKRQALQEAEALGHAIKLEVIERSLYGKKHEEGRCRYCRRKLTVIEYSIGWVIASGQAIEQECA